VDCEPSGAKALVTSSQALLSKQKPKPPNQKPIIALQGTFTAFLTQNKICMEKFTLFIAFAIPLYNLMAATWYVAPNGNDGRNPAPSVRRSRILTNLYQRIK
jgi:hypothetical protein